MCRPLPLILLLLRSLADYLPVGGVADLPLTIRIHGSRFPLPSLSCSLPPPSLLPCVPSPPPITLISPPIEATAPPPFVVTARMLPHPLSNCAITNADAGLTIPPVLVAAPVSTPPATAAAYTSAYVVVHPF